MFRFRINDEVRDWVHASFHWAIENGLLSSKTPLIATTHANFPVAKGTPVEVATGVVRAIQRHLDIEADQINITPLDSPPPEYRIDYTAMSAIGGTWQSDGNTALITFDPATQSQPTAFLSTMVHEVMHHRLHMIPAALPGGAEAEELSTDLHCITCGFGLQQMQGAEQAGWQGYLRQETRAYALALFVALTDNSLEEALTQLPSRSARLVRRAARLIARNSAGINDLRAALKERGA